MPFEMHDLMPWKKKKKKLLAGVGWSKEVFRMHPRDLFSKVQHQGVTFPSPLQDFNV